MFDKQSAGSRLGRHDPKYGDGIFGGEIMPGMRFCLFSLPRTYFV